MAARGAGIESLAAGLPPAFAARHRTIATCSRGSVPPAGWWSP